MKRIVEHIIQTTHKIKRIEYCYFCTGGNLLFNIDWASLQWEGNLPFLLCFTLYSRANSKYKLPGGAYIRRGDLTEGFCVTILGGLYLEGLIHGGLFSEFYGN